MNFSNFTRPPSGWFDALFVPVALLVAFGSSLFLRGTGSVLFVPALTGVFAASAFLLFKNLRTGAGLPGNVGSVFLFLFWLYLGVSLSWSTVPFMSTLFFLILGSLPLLFFSLVGAPKIVLRYTAIGIGGGLGVLALWALVQFFFFYDSYGPRIHHPLMNPNNLAALFNMGLFVALGLYAAAPNKKTSLL
ncbi:MAG: hypothetical protein KDJ15_07200, partial [Alphaproteobacteria bacterium]|nr:hypothetical protein [Alphaproteobacteria bacterium]